MTFQLKTLLTILLVMLATSLIGLIGAMSNKKMVYGGAGIAIFVEMFVSIGYLIYCVWY